MKVLLTGATGFLGSNLLRRLCMDGHEVAALKRRSSRLERVSEFSNVAAWYNADEIDLALPFQRHGHFDAVIHTATRYGRNNEPTSLILESNTTFPLRLLETAAFFNVETFFNTDSYFNTDTIRLLYLNKYALTKKYFTECGRLMAESGSIRFVNIRLEHMYGSGDASHKFTMHIIRQCLQNVSEIPLTAGEQRRDFIYIDDVIAAYMLLLEKQAALQAGYIEVGVGSGCAVPVRTFAELVHRLCHSTSHLEFGALPYRPHEIMASAADTSMLLSLGWQPRFSLEEGLKKAIEQEAALL
jgi:nucleoside-diphosphate-sugar epimerase